MAQIPDEEIKLVDATGKNMDEIARGGGEFGWMEEWGQEIIHKEIISRLKPKDIVLDLASGDGRASNVFSMRNIPVITVDLNKERLEEVVSVQEMKTLYEELEKEKPVSDFKRLFTHHFVNDSITSSTRYIIGRECC